MLRSSLCLGGGCWGPFVPGSISMSLCLSVSFHVPLSLSLYPHVSLSRFSHIQGTIGQSPGNYSFRSRVAR